MRTTEVNKIVTVVLKKDDISCADEAYQWNYGQILRIQGGNLPKVVEVHFSLEETSGTSVTRIGTTVDGVTEVPIPDSHLENNNCSQDYTIYAYIYLEDGTAGRTEYEIAIPVKARTKPEVPGTPEEPELFRETVKAVNDAADRAETAEQNAGKHAASASESADAAEKTKEDALKEVGEKKREAIEAIQEQEETSVGKITTHTDDEIQRILNQTAESKGGLEQTITNADASKEELDESIQTAGDTKTALDKSTELAGTAKTELDTSTQKAGEAKTALDGSTNTAGEMQETLSATVKQAVQDIQNAGSEQLGKMQAVAEELTADREQITTNKEDIGSLKEDLADKVQKKDYAPETKTESMTQPVGKDENGKLWTTPCSVGADGKSAYQYAQDGGYTGTETEFAEKLAQEQLTGTTDELTPTHVYDAVSAGIPVKVQYTDSIYGLLYFTAFNVAELFNVIVSQTIVYYNGAYILAELLGDKSGNTWNTIFTTLAQKTDIPSELPNPNALTFTGAVTGNYDGSKAVRVEIPSAVTDDHINSLIDTKLGVIENGAY